MTTYIPWNQRTDAQKETSRKASRDYYRRNREKRAEWARDSRANNPESYRASSKRSREKLKAEVFNAYGGKCSCCGESNPMFLTIDHVNGDGSEHRKILLGNGQSVYRDIRNQNFPDTYRILCYNCNMGRERNSGVCPHKELVDE